MTYRNLIAGLLAGAVLLFTGLAGAQTMGLSRGHDLDALWAKAQQVIDPVRSDAVVLLESREITVTADGDVVTGVHRLVWVGTSLGIRDYADLRVPWNEATSTLDVQILRTWRDGQWWPAPDRISETAVVHTLPYGLPNAYDYGDQRETMLLHDGVELPCLMETAYTITERGLPAAEGRLVLPQADPAVLVELRLLTPVGMPVIHWSGNGAPTAEVGADGQTLTWQLHDVRPLLRPLTATPEAYEPCVWWSTWRSHDEMIDIWRARFDAAAAAFAPVAAELDSVLAGKSREVAGGAAIARATAAYIRDNVRSVRGDERLAARPAERVWRTAYGHALDRAVLMGGLLRHQGYAVEPVFVSERLDQGPVMVPGLNSLGRLHLVVTLPDQPSEAPLVYDPDQGTLGSANRLSGRRVVPMVTPFEAGVPGLDLNLLRVELTLSPAAEGGWTGRGYVDAGGDLAFGDLNLTAAAGVAKRVAAIAGAVLPGAEASETSVHNLDQDRVEAEFQIAVAAAEDQSQPLNWTIGAPAGGLLAGLPGDVHLTDATRASPVLLGMRRAQILDVRCDLAGRTATHLPATRRITNAAGSFELSAEVRDGWLHYRRVLTLEPGPLPADQWPALRELLLEQADAANGAVRLEKAGRDS